MLRILIRNPLFSNSPYIRVLKLTFNATNLNLVRAVHCGKLIDRSELEPGFVASRKLYVTPEVSELLDAQRTGIGFPYAEAKERIKRYLAGHLVLVSLDVHSRGKPDFHKLRNIDEVWEFCFRCPPPGWRLFGRFLQKDIFIALAAHDAHDLHGRHNGHAEGANEAVTLWQNIFPQDNPVRGMKVDNYFSGMFRDVNETY